MSTGSKIAMVCGGVILGAAVIGAGVYLGAKYIPYAVEEARHRVKLAELDHRPELVKTKAGIKAVKEGAKKAQKKVQDIVSHR